MGAFNYVSGAGQILSSPCATATGLYPMGRLLQPLLLLLATATDKALARHVQYLKTENQILRARLPKRLVVTPRERQRLLRFGRPLGPAIRHLITIVTPRTFLRWLHGESSSAIARPGETRGGPGLRRISAT